MNDTHRLGRAMELQAWFWYKECRFEAAKSEALHAAGVYGMIGAVVYVERCRTILPLAPLTVARANLLVRRLRFSEGTA